MMIVVVLGEGVGLECEIGEMIGGIEVVYVEGMRGGMIVVMIGVMIGEMIERLRRFLLSERMRWLF